MDFNHGEDRQMLADTLGRYLRDRYTIDTRRKIAASDEGWSRETWYALAELGIPAALFTEAAGGFGGTGFDIQVVFEGLGRALVVEPFLGLLMGGRALSLAGGQDERLAGAVAGETRLAFANGEPQGRYDLTEVETRAARDGAGWALTGIKSVVPQLEAADAVIVTARTAGTSGDEQGLSLFVVDKQHLAVRGYALIDGGRGGDLLLNATPATLIGVEGEALAIVEAVTAAGIVALSAEAIGAMDMLRDATIDYLRTRVQFGVPIGKFQALQHRMATVLLEIEQARSAVINAAAALEGDRPIRERAVSAAKFTIGRVGTLVAEEAIQMHGGIGMTWELPLPHYAKRLILIGHQLGDEDHHLERFVALGQAV